MMHHLGKRRKIIDTEMLIFFTTIAKIYNL